MTHPLAPYGWTSHWQALFDEIASGRSAIGRVTRRDRGHATVITESGEFQLRVRERRTGLVLVGDWVVVSDDGSSGDGVVAVLPRRSMLSRADPHKLAEQPTVANVDLVLIVCGADRPFKVNRVSRAVTQTWEAAAIPAVVFTKTDLPSDVDAHREQIEGSMPGTTIICVSARAGNGLDELRSLMSGKTSVLVGESGAGKSTLVNTLLGEDAAETQEVRRGDSKGRHTTTHRELHVAGTIVVIDTPGTRALGLWADVESVDNTFADIAELAEACRFSNCEHESEPGCAIKLAVAAGDIDAERVAAWKSLSAEAANAERRKDEHARRQQDRKFGRLVDEALRAKGRR